MRRLTTKEFIAKARAVHGEKYDYAKVEYRGNKTKVTITCLVHDWDFEQTPNSHLSGKGCQKCAGNKQLSPKEFIEKACTIHGDKYDYGKVEYRGNKTKVIITCPDHGDFEQTPNSHLSGKGCQKCATNYKLTTKDFIAKARDVHGDKYDYGKVEYVNNSTKVTITCPDHGDFEQIPSSHLSGRGCIKCGIFNMVNGKKSNTQEFIQKARNVHGDRYGYGDVKYIRHRSKITITCPEHGSFEQTPHSHLRGHGCIKCAERHKPTTNEFVKKARNEHGDKYDYSKVEYVNARTKVAMNCPKHGRFEQTPHSHLQGIGCPKCNSSKGEKKIRRILKKKQIEHIEQYRLKPTRLKCDFYLPKKNLIIEYDGRQHFEPIKAFGGKKGFNACVKRDRRKNEIAKEKGIRMIRIPYTKFDQIEKILAKEIGINPS